MNQAVELIGKVIGPALEWIGQTAPGIWALYVRQARIDAIAKIVTLAVSLAIVSALCTGAILLYRREKKRAKASMLAFRPYDDFCIVVFTTLGLIGAITVVVCILGNISPIMTALNNPEYYALQEVVRQIGSLR